MTETDPGTRQTSTGPVPAKLHQLRKTFYST